jgi:AcrR family transcriptional regulator
MAVPRAGLTEARVVDEAERIADEVGIARLTLAAIADRLGVRQPSLYKHIDGMDALQRGLSIRAKNELAQVLARAAVGRERGDAVTAISHAYRRWAHEHPGRYTAAQRAPANGDQDDIDASGAVVAVATDILAGYQLSGDDAIDATRALRSTLHGFVSLEAAGGFGLPLDIDRSFDRLVHGLITSLANWTKAPATIESSA